MSRTPKSVEPAGETHGRLTVVREAEPKIASRGDRIRMVLCACECGNRVTVRLADLRFGSVKSCGCLNRELRGERGRKLQQARWAQVKDLEAQVQEQAETIAQLRETIAQLRETVAQLRGEDTP